MSDANYQALSDKLDEFRADVDKRLDGLDKRLDILEERVVPAKWMIASVLIPLAAVALAFLGTAAVAIVQMAGN